MEESISVLYSYPRQVLARHWDAGGGVGPPFVEGNCEVETSHGQPTNGGPPFWGLGLGLTVNLNIFCLMEILLRPQDRTSVETPRCFKMGVTEVQCKNWKRMELAQRGVQRRTLYSGV
jgi:hypothetical protein